MAIEELQLYAQKNIYACIYIVLRLVEKNLGSQT